MAAAATLISSLEPSSCLGCGGGTNYPYRQQTAVFLCVGRERGPAPPTPLLLAPSKQNNREEIQNASLSDSFFFLRRNKYKIAKVRYFPGEKLYIGFSSFFHFFI